jgi:chromosome segregation ATPase
MDLMNDHRKKIRKLQGDLKANNVKLEEKDLLNKQYKSEIEDLRSSLQVNSDLLGKMTKHEEETQKAEKDKEGKEEDLEREINRLKQSLYKEEVRSQGLYQ